MHGQNVAFGDGVTFCPLLPAAGFVRLRIDALGTRPLVHPGRSSLFDTAFHSSATITDLTIHPRSRVNVPGLHLQSNPDIFPDPFGSSLPPPFGFLLPREVRSPRETRCPAQSQDLPFVSELSLPFRIFQSFRIKALSPIPNSGACLCELPDLPSLPVALKIITYHHALRINVPDPLLPARLTVLRTSWNHSHHAPKHKFSQLKKTTFLKNNMLWNQCIRGCCQWMTCE